MPLTPRLRNILERVREQALAGSKVPLSENPLLMGEVAPAGNLDSLREAYRAERGAGGLVPGGMGGEHTIPGGGRYFGPEPSPALAEALAARAAAGERPLGRVEDPSPLVGVGGGIMPLSRIREPIRGGRDVSPLVGMLGGVVPKSAIKRGMRVTDLRSRRMRVAEAGRRKGEAREMRLAARELLADFGISPIQALALVGGGGRSGGGSGESDFMRLAALTGDPLVALSILKERREAKGAAADEDIRLAALEAKIASDARMEAGLTERAAGDRAARVDIATMDRDAAEAGAAADREARVTIAELDRKAAEARANAELAIATGNSKEAERHNKEIEKMESEKADIQRKMVNAQLGLNIETGKAKRVVIGSDGNPVFQGDAAVALEGLRGNTAAILRYTKDWPEAERRLALNEYGGGRNVFTFGESGEPPFLAGPDRYESWLEKQLRGDTSISPSPPARRRPPAWSWPLSGSTF